MPFEFILYPFKQIHSPLFSSHPWGHWWAWHKDEFVVVNIGSGESANMKVYTNVHLKIVEVSINFPPPFNIPPDMLKH